MKPMKHLDTDPLRAAKRAWFRLKQIFMGRKSPYGIFLKLEARRLDDPTLEKLGPDVPKRLETLDALINEWIEKDLPDVTTHEPFRGLIKPAVLRFFNLYHKEISNMMDDLSEVLISDDLDNMIEEFQIGYEEPECSAMMEIMIE